MALLDTMAYVDLDQFNAIPNKLNKILDLVFSNMHITVNKNPEPLVKEDDHHPTLSLHIDILPSSNIKTKSYIKQFFKANYDVINEEIINIDWKTEFDNCNLDAAVDKFYDIIDEIIGNHVPTKIKPAKVTREKAKYHKLYKLYKNPRDYDTFALLRTRQKKLIKEDYRKFTIKSECNILDNPKNFWSFVKVKKGTSSIPNRITCGSNVANSPAEIVNCFSDYFGSVFNGNDNSSVDINNHLTACDEDCWNTDCLGTIKITPDIVKRYIDKLDINKGSGLDNIPPVFIVRCKESLAVPLCILFNRSITEGIMPIKWKTAKVAPIFKGGSKSRATDYRPVSVLPCISKLLEKIVYDSIYQLITKNIPENQHGFMRKRSVVSNLLQSSYYVLNNIDGGNQVDAIYTDFSKAFDKVSHNVLLSKLSVMGVHGSLLRWVTSYVTNRSQSVVVGGARSELVKMSSGVPQGSLLGPLFFNAYIFDIYKCFKNAHFNLFADDLKLFLVIDSLNDCNRLQNDLIRLQEYCAVNQLELNAKKCFKISYTRKTNKILHSYTIADTILTEKAKIRDLGVIMDNKMMFDAHISSIITRANKMLGFIMRIGRGFSCTETLKLLYMTHARSILEFASPVWSPQYEVYKKRIEAVQHKFIRHLAYREIIFYKDNYQYLEKYYGLDSLENRRVTSDMKLLYDIIHANIDCSELLSSLQWCVPIKRTRVTPLFKPLPYQTNYCANNALKRIMISYNKNFSSLDIFATSRNIFINNVREIIAEKSE
ncbi:hypothetical protein JYU34_018850 [Plutella xylostella]|uniref:Reverse transcriptase domain-containing protein n=1 Tax=Plutella xylostella TaxID=51655 RepID=A0ABQ7Q027_PLUXY|nr:hypothetical protein JYU34_018850 [Plutella xylostella]